LLKKISPLFYQISL